MANLAKTQAEWDRFYNEMSLWLCLIREKREEIEKLTGNRFQVRNINDFNANITAMTIAGVDYTAFTTADGRLYVRFVANGGDWDVEYYKAAGGSGGNLVAKATAVADGATGTLVAQNSSGISGTVTIDATVVAEADDVHQVEIVVDYPARLKFYWTETGVYPDDTSSRQAFQAALTSAALSASQQKAQIVARFASWLLVRGNHFANTNYSSANFEQFKNDGDGNVPVIRTGLLPALAQDMLDELTAGEQRVLYRNPTAGAGVFASSNVGKGTCAAPGVTDAAEEGRWNFVCNRGFDSGNWNGDERFTATFTPSDVTRPSYTAPVDLQISKVWNGTRGAGPLTAIRTLLKTGDGSNLHFAAASFFSTTGENSANTSAGSIYGKVTGAGPFTYSFYVDTTYLPASLVAQATGISAGGTFTATSQNSSGLTVTGKAGSAPVTGNTAEFDVQPFFVDNGSGVPDSWYFDVSVPATFGLIQQTLADELNAALNAAATGVDWSDDKMKAGTFYPFISGLDN